MSAADVLRLNGQLVLMHDHGETRLDLQRGTARSTNSVIPVADLVVPWDLRDDGALVLHVANQVTWVLHLEARGPAWRMCERRARWTCHHARLEPPSQAPQNDRTR